MHLVFHRTQRARSHLFFPFLLAGYGSHATTVPPCLVQRRRGSHRHAPIQPHRGPLGAAGGAGDPVRRAATSSGRCWTSSGRAATGFSGVVWQLRPKQQPSASGAGTSESRCYHRLQRCWNQLEGKLQPGCVECWNQRSPMLLPAMSGAGTSFIFCWNLLIFLLHVFFFDFCFL